MKDKKKFFLIFCFIIVIAFLTIGFLMVRNAVLLSRLRNEVAVLEKLDATTDRYNSEIKTSGDYALVEESIKSYLDDYAVLLQETLAIKNDERFTKILSYENYEKDGPEFVESLNYLQTTKATFNENVDKILKLLNKDTIIEYGEDKITDSYYLSLYEELILSDDMQENFNTMAESLYSTRDNMNVIFDKSSETLNFLVTNKDYWKLEDGEIKIMSQTLYDQYMTIVNSVNNNN